MWGVRGPSAFGPLDPPRPPVTPFRNIVLVIVQEPPAGAVDMDGLETGGDGEAKSQ
jgi:hypothetical protein